MSENILHLLLRDVFIAGCPFNFTYVPSGTGCYYVVQEKMSWDKAVERCVYLHPDAHLVVIDSAAKQNEVADLLYPYRGNYRQ